jgi:O-antigen/teichoic acid export membrane protein
LLNVFINQADYMSLGIAHVAESSIGAYVYAFNIAIQPLRLISSNVPVVLFPGLSHLSADRDKQVRATLRAMRLLTLVTMPVCMLQVLMAPALFRLILPPTWAEAVLPCQILTVGLMFNAACWPAMSLMLAQGRFHEQLMLTVGSTILFVTLLATAILWHPSIISVALAVALFHIIFSPFAHWIAVRRDAPRLSFVVETGPPLVAALIAALPCVLLQLNLPSTKVGDAQAIAVGGVLFAAVYAVTVYLLVPASLHDMGQQLLPLWHRLRGTPASAADVAMDATIVEAAEANMSGEGFVAPAEVIPPKAVGDMGDLP